MTLVADPTYMVKSEAIEWLKTRLGIAKSRAYQLLPDVTPAAYTGAARKPLYTAADLETFAEGYETRRKKDD